MSTKIILADDHEIVRYGLSNLLEKYRDMEVIAQAADGRTAVKLVRKLSPDVVVIDISMPDLNGIEATRQIIAQSPGVKIIALSMHSDKRFVLGMLEAGAVGYLLKSYACEELIPAIQAVLANHIYLSPKLSDIAIKGYINYSLSSSNSVSSSLSFRECEVLQLLAEGNSTKEIAAQLCVSVKTVETHRQHIMGKLDIYSVAELTKYAIREGITPL